MKGKDKKFNYSLGKLEAEIMDIVWGLKQCCVRDVLTRLNKKRKVAYTTVMTVMTRMADKGILRRELDESRAYIYIPKEDKDSFLATVSKRAIDNLIKEFGEVAVAQFIDIIESSDAEDLKKWRRKLRRIK